MTGADELIQQSARMSAQARQVLEDTQALEIWRQAGATANLVGSLRTGLMMTRRDIDIHVYSSPFTVEASFAAMARLAANPSVKRVEFLNSMDTGEMCLEWHAWCLDRQGEMWQLDIIHIMDQSPYAGYFEQVADRIVEALTPGTRLAILAIKRDMPPDAGAMGIEVYKAVIEDGVRDLEGFLDWKRSRPATEILRWMP